MVVKILFIWIKGMDIIMEWLYSQDSLKLESPGTHLGSYKPDFLWAEPHSWWADGCAGTGTPSLGRRTSHTSGEMHCLSPAGNAPVAPCSSTHTGSHRLWQTQPKSEPEELHPRGRLWPTCNTCTGQSWRRSITHGAEKQNIQRWTRVSSFN